MAADERPFVASDIAASLGFLSRFPVRVDGAWATERGARMVWAYPVAGGLIGLVLALLAAGFAAVLPASLAAALTLAAALMVTGALHEDGFADCCDGFWGGWTKERRLEIMKDSHIGAYGVIGLVMSLLIRWLGLSALISAGEIWLLIGVAAASRGAMTPLMATRNARGSGVSARVGPAPRIAWGAALLLSGLALCVFGAMGAAIALAMFCAALLTWASAHQKIGGQTGDVLGATQQMSEMAGLCVAAALLA
ncbi:MAG: adenosylcobinamide-GDP ribazoletransferase [Pseudomonadota bacterium]